MSKKEWGAVILRPSCLNYCLFCGRVSTTAEALRREEKDVAANLAEFKRRGVKRIEISGNDPIEYDKLVPLVKYMKKTGFIDIQLSTHGRQLSDESFTDALIAAGVNKFRIPLYGSCPKTHDAVTRAPGSFRETWQGVKHLVKKSGAADLQVSFLIMKQNKNDIIPFLDLMKKYMIEDLYIAYPFLANDDLSYYIPLKDLAPYVRKARAYAGEIGLPLRFIEIPYCVFGAEDEAINNTVLPPDLGEHCQPPGKHKTDIKDMPAYRLKKQAPMCASCACRDHCDGFPVNDVDRFGTGNLKPIKKKKHSS